jgi:hypothetical protein
MRHLVLYKLAGFFPTDWQPIGRELCPQKRCQKCAFSCTIRSKLHAFRLGKCKKGGFLQGGGATFWQAKNGGFWGPGRRARLVPRVAKTASQSPRGASSPSVFEEDVRFSRIVSYRNSINVSHYRHSELSERPEAYSFILFFIFYHCFLFVYIPRSVDCEQTTTMI